MLARTCSFRVNPRGFTLIELLVVIAVLTILIGILLPALGKARIAARQTATLAGLRQVGLGAISYSNDYRGELPALSSREEKAFLGLSVLARSIEIPAQAFINTNTQDTPAKLVNAQGRPVLAELDGTEITDAVEVTPSDIQRVTFHCSFAYDNDRNLAKSKRPVVFLGDRADYASGRTFSANWGGDGMCLLWTDGHAEFTRTRTIASQSDPNIYHHNEFGGEGADEVRDGVSVTEGTLDTHLRFFSEEEDDALLTD